MLESTPLPERGEPLATARTWASFPVAVDTKADGEAPATWVRAALFGDTVGTSAPRPTKGAQVYCEGRLSLGAWTGRDGEAKAGLNLAAREVQPMGQIGRRKPKMRSGYEQDAVPFDDPYNIAVIQPFQPCDEL